MIWFVAKVNGKDVGTIYIHNKEDHIIEESRYDAAIVMCGVQNMVLGIEDVRHNRRDPFYVLLSKVLRPLMR